MELIFTGDIFLGQVPMQLAPGLKDLFLRADFVIGNLECSATHLTKPVTKVIALRCVPTLLESLVEARVSAVTLANNHIFDFGQDAFEETKENLCARNIRYFGAGGNLTEAESPLFLTQSDISVALIGCAQPITRAIPAGPQSPGVTPCDKELLEALVSELAKKGHHVIVVAHWGYCDFKYPSAECVELVEILIGAGATSVIGHHSHVLNGQRSYSDGRFVAYSLGNFYFAPFNHMGNAVTTSGEASRGAVARLVIQQEGLKVAQLIPIRQEGNLVMLDEFEDAEKRLAVRSAPFAQIERYPVFWKRQLFKRIIERLIYWINPCRWRDLNWTTFQAAGQYLNNFLKNKGK